LYRTCILTDSTVIFTKPVYPGIEHVHIIPQVLQAPYAPSVEGFRQTFVSLGNRYHDIITILPSSSLNPGVGNARLAASSLKTPLNIQVLDSQSIAVGLGLLVQAAADSVQRGLPAQDICNLLRGMLRNIFAIFCLPDLSTLYQSGQIDQAQAIIGEMLGIIPIFVLENGKLIHVQKIRSPRHLVDILFEFVMEFDHLKFLALLQGSPFFDQECRNLRERINQNLRTPHLSEYTITPSLASLLGPRSIGIISMQKFPDERP
jgi:DegV family protein with EDD domain